MLNIGLELYHCKGHTATFRADTSCSVCSRLPNQFVHLILSHFTLGCPISVFFSPSVFRSHNFTVRSIPQEARTAVSAEITIRFMHIFGVLVCSRAKIH